MRSRLQNFSRLIPQRLLNFSSKPVLISCLLLVCYSTDHPQNSPAKSELPQLFQVALPSADVAVLFDASLSMRNHGYDEVRQAVIDFVPALSNKELLHLRVFGDVAGAPLEGPAAQISGNIADHLPVEPIFHNTDLGGAISKAFEFFERPNANDVQALFLLTDGLHQPPPGSLFTRDFINDPNWQALRQRAEALCRRRKVLVYGFGLAQQTDVSLLLRLFPAANVEVVAGNAAQLAATLRRVRETLRQTQLRGAVEQELNSGAVEVRFTPNQVREIARGIAPLATIRNSYRRLPVLIDGVKLQSNTLAGEQINCALDNLPRALSLAPGQQWQSHLKCDLQTEPSRWRIGRVERIHQTNLQLTPEARFSHEKEIAQLNLGAPAPRSDVPPLRIELRVRDGAPYWLLTIFFLTISTMIWLRRRRNSQINRQRETIEQRHAERTRLIGNLKIWPAGKNEPDDDGMDLSIQKTQQLDLGMNPDGALELHPPQAEAENIIAHLSAHLLGAMPGNAEAGKVEFRLEAARGHRLALESGGEWREAARVALCDRDLIELDGRWRIRYDNHRLRTRAEVDEKK